MQPDLRQERDRFVGFAFATAHLLLEVDEAATIVYAAGAACGLTEGGAERLVGRNLKDLAIPDDREFLGNVLARIRERSGGPLTHVIFRTTSGEQIQFLIGGRRMADRTGSLHLGLIPAAAIGARETMAPGLNGFLAAAQKCLADSAYTGASEGMTLLVLEGIAQAIEQDGTLAAAEIVRKVQAYLRSVSAGGNLAGLLATGKFGVVRAAGVTEAELRRDVGDILAAADLNPNVHAFGVTFDGNGLTDADAARALTYSIKQFVESDAPRPTVGSMSEGVKAIVDQTVQRMVHAREIMDQRSMEIVYQPIVHIQTGTVHHFEALSRISGVESIGTWMHFAEESGLIQDYDLILTGAVLDTMSANAKAGWRPMIAINLSARSLQSEVFRRSLEGVLDLHKPLAPHLMIEVTETASVTDLPRMHGILTGYQRRGHKICLDDVGAGTTSFETMRSLPADFVKLDGVVLRAASEEGHNLAMLKAIAHIALERGAELIAEQIETPAHAALAKELGAKFGQGWLYGRPSADVSMPRDRGPGNALPDWQPITRIKPVRQGGNAR
jgi:EAL domain-containing protein (putative c-di-GMP-specific phosphodiesterase class I)/PAS domain-containing protein